MEKDFITIVVFIFIVIFAVVIGFKFLPSLFKIQNNPHLLPQPKSTQDEYRKIIESSQSDYKNLMDKQDNPP